MLLHTKHTNSYEWEKILNFSWKRSVLYFVWHNEQQEDVWLLRIDVLIFPMLHENIVDRLLILQEDKEVQIQKERVRISFGLDWILSCLHFSIVVVCSGVLQVEYEQFLQPAKYKKRTQFKIKVQKIQIQKCSW